jgi:hypothetical protein
LYELLYERQRGMVDERRLLGRRAAAGTSPTSVCLRFGHPTIVFVVVASRFCVRSDVVAAFALRCVGRRTGYKERE